MQTLRSFQVQPETNNSVTLWVKDYPLHIMADNRDLIVTFDTDDFAAEITENGVRIQRIKKHLINQKGGSVIEEESREKEGQTSPNATVAIR